MITFLKHPRRLAVCAGVPLLLLSGLAWLWFGESQEQSTNDAFISADYTMVAPKIAGFIDQVLVQDNQRVKAGQLLARIDDRDYRTALAVAKANVATAKAQRDNAEAVLQQHQAVIGQAVARLQAEQAEQTFARNELERYRQLAEQGASTLQNLQQVQSRFETVQAREAETRAALQATRQQSAVLIAQREVAQAAVLRAEAEQQRAELDLSHTRLLAPVDGMVGRSNLRVGTYVSPGSILLAVVPLEQAFVIANFQETQLTHMRPGQPVSIRVDSYPDLALHGHVQSLAPATGVTFAAIAPDNATGNFTKVVQRIPVKILLDADQVLSGHLRVGMSVVVRVDTHQRGHDAVLAGTFNKNIP